MQTVFVNEPAKPPPIPTSVAEHSRPTPAAQQPINSHWVNFHLIVPDLSIAQWASRLLKFSIGTLIATLALVLPVLALVGIIAAIAAALK